MIMKYLKAVIKPFKLAWRKVSDIFVPPKIEFRHDMQQLKKLGKLAVKNKEYIKSEHIQEEMHIRYSKAISIVNPKTDICTDEHIFNMNERSENYFKLFSRNVSKRKLAIEKHDRETAIYYANRVKEADDLEANLSAQSFRRVSRNGDVMYTNGNATVGVRMKSRW